MKRLTLAQRMYLTLAPLALMGLIVSLITAKSLQNNAAPLVRVQKLKELALTSLSLLMTQDDATKTMMLDPDNPTSNMRKITAYDENQKVIAAIKGLSESVEIRDTINQMSDLDAKVLRDIDTSVLEAVGDSKTDKAKQLYFGTYEPQRAKYEAYVRKIVDIAEKQAKTAEAQLKQANSNSLRNILGALLAGLAIVVACLAYLATSTARRMNQVVFQLNQEHMAAQTSADLITQASHSVFEGVSSTSAAIQEIHKSVDDLASRLKATDEHATSARESSAKAARTADHASASISHLVEASREAQKGSEQVLGIIEVINAISFKTNLLALNAAVEAARAGQAGAGFAVVADEVRNLAKSSADAARETADLVQASVSKTKENCMISEKAAEALASTISEAHQIHSVVDEIASNSRLQNHNIGQITQSLISIGEIGQKSALEAEKTRQVAEALRKRSRAVEEVIEQLVLLVGARA